MRGVAMVGPNVIIVVWFCASFPVEGIELPEKPLTILGIFGSKPVLNSTQLRTFNVNYMYSGQL
jgi:hypothetical protein